MDDVFGLRRIAEHRQDYGARPLAVAVHKDRERLLVSAKSGRDELTIGMNGAH